MNNLLSEVQKATLNFLLDQYEGSKTFRGENKVLQTFTIDPTLVFKQYKSDFVDLNLVRDFEQQMKDLEKLSLLKIRWKNGQIDKLAAASEKWEDYYSLLERKDKHSLQKEQFILYESYLGTGTELEHFCLEQIERLRANKKAKYEMEISKNVLRLCKFLIDNQEDILERELSMAILGDSKMWNAKYRTKVCDLLLEYGNFQELLIGVNDEKEKRRIILEEYHVFANPSYVYFKGNANLVFDDGQKFRLNLNLPMAFTTSTLSHLKSIEILDQKVMTVENLTSFNRIHMEDIFYIFLSGYHNTIKQELIRKISENNTRVQWFHFGDIDPDGFYIIEHLKKGTGINFAPIYMDVDLLKEYRHYTKPLEKNDILKANALLQNNKYTEVMRYLLETGRKLEQEIISWMQR